MPSQTPPPDGKTFVAAVLTVASAYAFFLLFAQFGFLQAVRTTLGEDAARVRPLMAAMGLAGIAGSVIAARGFKTTTSRRWLVGGFIVCMGAVGCSLAARSGMMFTIAAALTGLGAGLTTVTLAGMMHPAVGVGRLGLILGLGTGLAYGFCNLPGIFGADARTQSLIALGAAGLGAVMGSRLAPRFSPNEIVADSDYSRVGVAGWIAIFLALVCLDSALFYFIQHDAASRQAIWGSSRQEMMNAATHLVAATLAGWALDRGRLGTVVLFGAIAVVGVAWWFTQGNGSQALAGWGYIAGVSAYSTALVFYPARSGSPALAATLYAVAGWGGSALGIGLVETRADSIPLLAGVCGVMLVICLAGRHFTRVPNSR